MQTVSYIFNALALNILLMHMPHAYAAYPVTHESLERDIFCKTELFQSMDSALASLKQYELKKAQEAKEFQENTERVLSFLRNMVRNRPAPTQAKQKLEDINMCKSFSCPETSCTFRCKTANGLKQHRTMLHIKKNIDRVRLCLSKNQKDCDTKKNLCSGCHETFTPPGFKRHKMIMQRAYIELNNPH